MNLKTTMFLLPLAAAFTLSVPTASAGHYMSREQAAQSAHRVSDFAERFHQASFRERHLFPLRHHARRFAVRAERVHQMIEGGVSADRVAPRIARLQDDYFEIRSQLLRNANRYGELSSVAQWGQVGTHLDRLIVLTGVEPDAGVCSIDLREGRPPHPRRIPPSDDYYPYRR